MSLTGGQQGKRVGRWRWGAAAACCRAVAVYSLHTMTNLCPDELECDKNAGPGRAAEREVRKDRQYLIPLSLYFTGLPLITAHITTETHNYNQTHEKLRRRPFPRL